MRIDFYQLAGRFQDPLEVVCVLVGKAWPETRSIAIVGPRPALAELDDRLWKKPAGRFLPHGMEGGDPIALVEAPPAEAGILINLDPEAPLPTGRYQRVLEIVPRDEKARQSLRRRWRDWKARGAELHHHVLK